MTALIRYTGLCLLSAALTMPLAAAGSGRQQAGPTSEPENMPMSTPAAKIPDARSFTSAPPRNRIRVALNAPVAEVWALIGDPSRYPEYSSGLERVEAKKDAKGTFSEYVCHFKPETEGSAGIAHRVLVPWYEPNRGYASVDEEPNAFGLTDSVTLVSVVPSKGGSIATWEAHYHAADLDANRIALDQALADIGEHLIRRFGGTVLERHVDR